MKPNKTLLNKWINNITFIEGAYDSPTLHVQNDSLLIKENKDSIHIAVAGSNGNRADWIGSRGNFSLTQDLIPDVNKTATRGFVNSALECYDAISPLINKNKVVICGHSRGGPIASIVACLIYEKLYIDNIELTTFGSPRFTTDESFKDYKFIRESCRVVFSGDGITKMPKRCFCNFKIKKMIELGREYILGEEKDRHAGKILDNYDAHQISMYKSICYDMERKT